MSCNGLSDRHSAKCMSLLPSRGKKVAEGRMVGAAANRSHPLTLPLSPLEGERGQLCCLFCVELLHHFMHTPDDSFFHRRSERAGQRGVLHGPTTFVAAFLKHSQ